MDEEHSPIKCAFYSATLIREIARRTRVVISVLKTSRNVRRRKVSPQKANHVEVEKERYWDWDESYEKDYFSVTPLEKKKRPSSSWRGKTSCCLCKATHQRVDIVESPVPARDIKSPKAESSAIRYLPITRTQPPSPPSRTTSLPHFKQLRRLARTAHPSAPLPSLSLTQRDGSLFQWLVLAQADKYSLHEFMDPIWGLLLQVSHIEPCVRHALLAVAALRRDFQHGSTLWECIGNQDQYNIVRHYNSAIRELQIRLASVKEQADLLTWEISFISTYLFTVLQLAMRNASGTHFWLKAGYRILKQAFRVFGDGIHASTLPASMRDVAWAFGRLETRRILASRSRCKLATSLVDDG